MLTFVVVLHFEIRKRAVGDAVALSYCYCVVVADAAVVAVAVAAEAVGRVPDGGMAEGLPVEGPIPVPTRSVYESSRSVQAGAQRKQTYGKSPS